MTRTSAKHPRQTVAIIDKPNRVESMSTRQRLIVYLCYAVEDVARCDGVSAYLLRLAIAQLEGEASEPIPRTQ